MAHLMWTGRVSDRFKESERKKRSNGSKTRAAVRVPLKVSLRHGKKFKDRGRRRERKRKTRRFEGGGTATQRDLVTPAN